MDQDLEPFRRMWVAVVLQAFRDLCSENVVQSSSVLRWLTTPDFIWVCHMAKINEDQVRESIKRLYRFEPAMRREMLREITSKVLGSPT